MVPPQVYQYVGLDEARKATEIRIHMSEVLAIHVRTPDGVVYLEGSGVCWTLRLADVVIDDLYQTWYRARGMA